VIFNDTQLGVFVAKVLHLGPGKRKEFVKQVDNLITELEKKLLEDASFKVKGFKKTGSITKGTVLKPRGENGVDADIAIFLDVSESDKGDVAKLHTIIKNLLTAVYPMKAESDFEVQPRTLGIHFRQSGLDIDLVPVIPIPTQPGFGWQPSSGQDAPIKTNIQGQLDFIAKRKKADPRFKTIVRLLKHWRNEKEIDALRSFAIELIVAHLYDVHGAAPSLEAGLQRFFLYVAQSGLTTPVAFPELGKIAQFPSGVVVILDPVNRDNNVTRRITESERKDIVAEAVKAWEALSFAGCKDTKGETLDLWKEVMGRSFTVDDN
jgi:tRNA nucleotidyltransferase (CCA-adding enzyme)